MNTRSARPRLWHNWAGTVSCEPAYCAYPVTLEQIQSEVMRISEEGERLRVIGSGHSFSELCWADENHLSLSRFTGIDSVDFQRRRVWVRAGTQLHRLTESLADRGLALENAPDLDRQTLAGALATGSHGTGGTFGNLATLVTGLRMVRTDGSVSAMTADGDPETFHAHVVALGALGVVTHIELQCVDDYRLRVDNRSATLGEALERLDELRRDHRNSSFYWFPNTHSALIRTADVTRDRPTALAPVQRGLRQRINRNTFAGMSLIARHMPQTADRMTQISLQMLANRSEVYHARNAYAFSHPGRFQQMEYALPVEHTVAVLRALQRAIGALSIRIPLPIEVRFVAADPHWLSPHSQRDSVCISIPAYTDMESAAYFEPLVEIFDRYDGRPHWGMVHKLRAEALTRLYPRFEDFRELRRQADPRGLLLNRHLARLFAESLR